MHILNPKHKFSRYQSSDISSNAREGKLIIVRHGQSTWNVTSEEAGTTARFTGWADISLTDQGVEQAAAAGRAIKSLIKSESFGIDAAYCSLLKRARDTLDLSLEELDLIDQHSFSTSSSQSVLYKIPVIASWRLNERHYGALVGLSKDGAERLYGKEQLTAWRNGWDVAPPPMDLKQLSKWEDLYHTTAKTVVSDPQDSKKGREFTIHEREPVRSDSTLQNDYHHQNKSIHGMKLDDLPEESSINMPATESLSDTCRRILPIWTQGIAPRLREGQTVLVVAHANTIRGMLYHIDPSVTKETMKAVKIPSASPLIYGFKSTGQQSHEQKLCPLTQQGEIYVPGGLTLLQNVHLDNRQIHEKGDEGLPSSPLLHGTWIETKEIESLAFCSSVGERNLEYEIA